MVFLLLTLLVRFYQPFFLTSYPLLVYPLLLLRLVHLSPERETLSVLLVEPLLHLVQPPVPITHHFLHTLLPKALVPRLPVHLMQPTSQHRLLSNLFPKFTLQPFHLTLLLLHCLVHL